jgi:hypothetical protein
MNDDEYWDKIANEDILISDKTDCFNNPKATWGGECYQSDCMHHMKTEPLCNAPDELDEEEDQ